MAANNKHRTLLLLLLAITLCSSSSTLAQDSNRHEQYNKKRLTTLVAGGATGYTFAMTGLYQLWYKDSEQQPFRFFNDNKEWKQVDKIGHFGSAFYMSYAAHKGLRWAGIEQRKSAFISSATGFLIMVPIEIFDGYSNAYGASTGDLFANAGGASFFYAQQALWNEVRIYPKFSFHRTSLAPLRPQLLGDDYISEFFKDYNGQTYWFSVDMDKFVRFPKWLNFAVGYGAEEMIYARDYQNELAGFQPYRQYYLSLDFDLTAIKTRSKVLKTLVFLANIIKIPAPAVSFSKHGTKGYALYF